jgi:hypothetical protein
MNIRHSLIALALVAAALRPAGAQGIAPREKLAARLDTGAVAALMPLIDAARAQGLPTDPLVQKALEGASKRAPTDRIVLAVRRLSTQLGTARTALGDDASQPELVAGASALQAGVRPEVLTALRDERPDAALTVPLGVLAELIARGVPADTGAMAVAALMDANATDAELVALRRDVERDIGIGAPPTTALIARTTGFTGSTLESAFNTRTGNAVGSSVNDARNTAPKAPRRRP